MPSRLGSRRPRTTHHPGVARTPSRAPEGQLVLRVCGGLVLAATGVEHLVLDVAGGYGHIPVIGTLFLFQAAGALALGVAVLTSPRPLASIAGALFALATLGGYVLSLDAGLFGFHEVVTAAGIAAGLLEIVAFSLLASAGTLSLASQRLSRAQRNAQRNAQWARIATPVAALVAVASFAVGLAQASPAGGNAVPANAQVVRGVQVAGYGDVLANPHGRTLYVLRARDGMQRPCNGGCRSIWPPLLVAASTRHVRGGPGVPGALGLVGQGSQRQVTYNGYRLYTYAGDSGPRQSNGERVVSFGGTWYLVRASATRAAATAVTRRD